MRIRGFKLGKSETDSSIQYLHAPPGRMDAWYALFSAYKQLFIQNIQTTYLTESRTSDTQILCATASARRLCGN